MLLLARCLLPFGSTACEIAHFRLFAPTCHFAPLFRDAPDGNVGKTIDSTRRDAGAANQGFRLLLSFPIATRAMPSGPAGGTPGGPPGSSQSVTQSILAYPTTQQGRVVIAALASCTITAASIFSYQAGVRLARRRKLAKDVDSATHRDQDVHERKLHFGSSQAGGGGGGDANAGHEVESSVDGGTPRYLNRLSSLAPAKGNKQGAASPSPLRRENSRQSLGRSSTLARGGAASTQYDDSLMREQLARNFAFLGDDAMKNLKEAFVIVVGLGGVGSHTALSLIRSGVGHVRLIDFDQVSLSSLNRHAVATLEDVGRPKVVVCQEHFRGIAPWVHIQAWVEIFNESEASRLFSPFRVPGATFGSSTKEIPPTYVVDCIDNLNTKVGLLAYCHENGIKVISSMGASAKCDPTRICIGDLTATEEDPLAKSVRRRLRERGIPEAPPKESAQPQGPQKQQQKKGGQRGGARRGGGSGGRPQDGTQTPPRLHDKDPLSTNVTPRPSSSRSFPTPSEKAKEQGEFRRPEPPSRDAGHRLSRASSASSFGSGDGVFYTPQGTPKEEERDWDKGNEPDELKLDEKIREVKEDADSGADADADSAKSNAASRPSMKHHSSSGLEILDASPMTEKDAAPFSIESTPGFAPTRQSDGEAGEQAEQQPQESSIWKRESARRVSEGPDSEPHRSQSQQSRRVQVQSSPITPPAADESDAAPAPTPPKPWTSSNPRYLIPCIFSTEKPAVDLLPLDEAELAKDGGVEMLRALEDGNEWRVRVLPVLGPIPAIFGLSIATYIICDVSGRSDLMEPLQSKIKRRTAERTQKELEAAERLYPSPGSTWSKEKQKNPHSAKGRNVPFLLDDILYLCHEVFHARSVVPPFTSLTGGCLLRWDSTLPLSFHNVALFTREEAKVHTEEVLKKGKSPFGVWGADAAEMWRKRMEEERWYSRFR